MSIIVINPNSTATLTKTMTKAAQSAAPNLTFDGWTSNNGPTSIQREDDGTAAAPHLLDLAKNAAVQNVDNIDAIILGCAGMVRLVNTAKNALEVQVIDPVSSAATAMTWLTATS